MLREKADKDEHDHIAAAIQWTDHETGLVTGLAWSVMETLGFVVLTIILVSLDATSFG